MILHSKKNIQMLVERGSPFFIQLLLKLAIVFASLITAHGQVDPFSVFDSVDPGYVMVAAHRHGYISNGSRTHPENSLSAAQNSMALGVDILETDIRMTSDGGLVVMHDSSVNRTTNGSGTVASMTLAQVRALYLLGPGDQVSNEIVPTLEELMLAVKGKALVNLDKVDINNITLRNNIMAVLQATGTVDHAIFKGGASASQVATMRAAFPGEPIIYMPVLSNSSESGMISMLNSHTPPATELIFNSSSTTMLSATSLSTAISTDTHIWINSLWSDLCAGHHDSIALGGNPGGSWGWLIDKSATIIQTDNAPQLIPYLESLGLRGSPAPEPPVAVDYDFDDGSLQGWVNTRSGGATENPNRFESRGDQGRGGGLSPDNALMHDGDGSWLDGRDVDHDTLVVSSPAFDFDEADPTQWDVSLSLLGGTGNLSASPASLAALSTASATDGFMGVALRRVSDGVYLLYDRRGTGGQDAWSLLGWDSIEIEAAITGDAADETYQIDLIDQFHGDWGWVMLDSVRIEGILAPEVQLLVELGPQVTPSSQYIALDNPLTDAAASGDVVATSGSLFLYGELRHGGGYSTLGLYPAVSDSTEKGAIDFGRNTASEEFAAFDYLDNKGSSSSVARLGGSPGVTIDEGVYTIIIEVRFDSATSGTLRGWIHDGVNGALDIASPNVETTFSNGFTNATDDLYMRIGSGSASSWANLRAIWAGDGTGATRGYAFSMLIPGQTYAGWVIEHLSPGQSLSINADADGDNRLNLVEYYMGSDAGDAESREAFSILNVVADSPVIEYSRAKNRPDVSGELQWSADLTNWYVSGESDGIRTIEIDEATVSASGADPELIQATLQTISGSVSPRIFVRLNIE